MDNQPPNRLDQLVPLSTIAAEIGCCTRTLQRWCRQPSPLPHGWRRAANDSSLGVFRPATFTTRRLLAWWLGRHKTFTLDKRLTVTARAYLRGVIDTKGSDDD